MNRPAEGYLDAAEAGHSPRLHYLEWNVGAPGRTLFLLHGNSANASWWQPLADAISPGFRLLALDQRGHGDSGWVRPAAYSPRDYAADVRRVISSLGLARPIVVGHSMGAINTLALTQSEADLIEAAVAIEVAVRSTRGRDRYLRRLRSLPTVTYLDHETALRRFRLMPDEGEIAPEVLQRIAEYSITRNTDGAWTMKFDRESFFGSDGLDVATAIASSHIPLLLIRAEHSRIMTLESARGAALSNPAARLVEIPRVHHHLIIERADLVAREIEAFIAHLG
ncbi:MAG TPA: alpha/beta hydrolase [Candidatus Binataceae bacterium]